MKRDLEVETEMLCQDLTCTVRQLAEMPMNYLRRECVFLEIAEANLRDLIAKVKESRAA
jgi:hypothetical protein